MASTREDRAILTMMHRMGWRLAAFALLAMAVRAVVPAGYMLAYADGAEGRYLTIELCEDHSGPLQVVDLDTGEVLDAADLPKSEKPQNDGKPCVFAGAGGIAPPELESDLALFVIPVEAPGFDIVGLRPGRGIAAPPPPSTGPPSLI